MRHHFWRKAGFLILVVLLLVFGGWKWGQMQDGVQREEVRERQLDFRAENTKLKDELKRGENEEQKKNKKQEGRDREAQEENAQESQEENAQESQEENAQEKKEESIEGVSYTDPPSLDLASVRAMEAGAVLDTARIDENMIDSLFSSEEVGEELRQKISGISYQENDHISLGDLRYIRVLHMGFDGQTHIGELLVNASVADDMIEIMSELYKNSYPIERMLLIDEYGADDELSMSDNNTSAFNYREIAGSSRMSRHSLGVAIDINPRYNPYVKKTGSNETKISPANGADYADRSQEFDHKIDENDLCYQLFTEHGFTWGGSWNSVKDYQHFEK